VVKRAKKLTSDTNRCRLLISAGNVGLLLSIDKYDPEHGTRFLTYAEWWIRKEMYDAINSSALVHIPPQKKRAILKELREGNYVCTKCGLRTKDVYGDAQTPCTHGSHEFEDPNIYSSSLLGNGVPIDAVPSVNPSTMEGDVIDADVQKSLRAVIDDMDLNERDKFIVYGYYNIPHEDRQSSAKNLNQLSSVLGVTPERVRQLKKHTMSSIKKALKRKSVTGYADLSN
jgi:RNA polymerase sigma factor (sigma-70 family)